MVKDKLYLLGYASGVAGVDVHVGEGPGIIQQSSFMQPLHSLYQWIAMIHPAQSGSIPDIVSIASTQLAKAVAEITRKQQAFCVIGGDHTSAIGTFSGVYDALHEKGDVGLIWIDAHMDSHTPETSVSGRLHGMPLACLLGHGYDSLTHILHAAPKLKPENVCLIGIRSFEPGEAALLERLNVRVYSMEEVKQRGFATVLNEAVKKVSAHTIGYGISLDMDAIDSHMAPGVDVPEANGVDANELMNAFADIVRDPKWIGTEIVEFDPSRDHHQLTEQLIVSLLKVIHGSGFAG